MTNRIRSARSAASCAMLARSCPPTSLSPGVSTSTISDWARPGTRQPLASQATFQTSLVQPPWTSTAATWRPTRALISADLPVLISPNTTISTRPQVNLRSMVCMLASSDFSRSFSSGEQRWSRESVASTEAIARW